MTESIKLMKLDVMMTKYYWKEMLVALLILTISIGINMPIILNVILFLCANTMLSYPFIIQEKDRMDKFYSTLAVSKLDILRSKYLSALFYMVVIIIVLIPLNLIIYYGMKVEASFQVILLLTSIGMLCYSGVAAIQLPCYFKWGYTKSKLITVALPMAIGAGVPVIVIGGAKFLGKENMIELGGSMVQFFVRHNSAIVLGILVLAVICLGISYQISRKIYIENN